MKNIIPRVAAIHDMSGFGRCSLTVIIPVLSSMGIQVCPFPTAILSTHPGGFGNFYFQDLTSGMRNYARHWEETGLEFECIYSGFLGSEAQIDIVSQFFDAFKKSDDQLIIVDPVMGDHGKLYKIYTQEMKRKMGLLIQRADIITPNLTEACFLLNEEYPKKLLSMKDIEGILHRLSCMGPEIVVITGVEDSEGRNYNVAYDRKEGAFIRSEFQRIPAVYPGTGDIFTSVLIGGLMSQEGLSSAMERATRFLTTAVKMTFEAETPNREGILLERVLGTLNQ